MYFNNVKTLAELKSQYRKLAFTLHPDRGGNAKEFSAMQIEYEKLFAELKNAKDNQAKQTRYTYNGQGNQTSDASYDRTYQKTSYSYNEQANRTRYTYNEQTNQAGNANKERAQSGQRRKRENRNNYGHRDVEDGIKDVLEILIHLSGLKIELCGKWLWISGNTKKHIEALKAAGCKLAAKKKMWYWRPADSASTQKREARSMAFIRKKYGSVKINAEEKDKWYAYY